MKQQLNTRQSRKVTQVMTHLTRFSGAAALLLACSIALNSDERSVAVDSSVDETAIAGSNTLIPDAGSPSATHDAFIAPPATDAKLGNARSGNATYPPAAGATLDLMGPAEPSLLDDQKSEDKPRLPRDKMSGPVAALAFGGGTGMVDIVVRYEQFPALFDDEFVAELGGEVTRTFQTLRMRGIRISATALEDLAGDDNVDWLSVDDPISFSSVASREAANLPSSGSAFAGYSGSNVGIAVLDTGIGDHPDLDANIVQYSFLNGAYPVPTIVNGQIADLNDDPRVDDFGHGTHVAGILTGSGADSSGDFKGSASGATILSLQVLNGDGGGSMSDVMAALDWLLVYGSYFDVRVVNLSLGKGISESNTTDPLVLAVEDLWDAGMVVVVAAGNDGYAGSMTITSPANSRKVITVGSLTDNGTGSNLVDDYVSNFSSIGPTIGDLVLKPDLVAPGNRVVAAIPAGTRLAQLLPGRVRSCRGSSCASTYLEMSGTSMATPLTSAAVALMLDQDPSLSPATVKARLMRSARKLDIDASTAGAGALDIDAALGDSGTITGEALSPLMIPHAATNGVLIEDTGSLWGNEQWGAGYLFNDGFTWATGYSWTDETGISANGFAWTDENVWARGYGWTDGDVMAKGYGWTDTTERMGARSLLESDGSQLVVNDDPPAN